MQLNLKINKDKSYRKNQTDKDIHKKKLIHNESTAKI